MSNSYKMVAGDSKHYKIDPTNKSVVTPPTTTQENKTTSTTYRPQQNGKVKEVTRIVSKEMELNKKVQIGLKCIEEYNRNRANSSNEITTDDISFNKDGSMRVKDTTFMPEKKQWYHFVNEKYWIVWNGKVFFLNVMGYGNLLKCNKFMTSYNEITYKDYVSLINQPPTNEDLCNLTLYRMIKVDKSDEDKLDGVRNAIDIVTKATRTIEVMDGK
jgi:hypothetical protein